MLFTSFVVMAIRQQFLIPPASIMAAVAAFTDWRKGSKSSRA